MATRLKDRASIEAIIREMTVQEKAECITGGSPFCTRKMEKYGIPSLLWLDGGTGFNMGQMLLDRIYQKYAAEKAAQGEPVDESAMTDRMGGLSVILKDITLLNSRREMIRAIPPGEMEYGCYPPGMALGATWNPKVIEACGHALGQEANARGVDVLLGTPNVNIHRDPRNGRLFEGYSEDPCLVSKLAPAFVRGVQAEGVVADVKHFAANNQETERMGVDESISERALREIYLPGFRACVEAGCKTVMAAYNQINGVPCAQNHWLLTDVLRGEWGFTGCVVTDWAAAYDQVEAASAGTDVVMPGPRQVNTLLGAVQNGRLSESRLDECVRNLLNVVLDAPAFRGKRDRYDKAQGISTAYRAAAQSITLLKNEGVLPLKQDACLAFYGRRSRDLIASGAGSARVDTVLNTQLLTCAAERLGEERVSFETVTDQTTAVIVTVSANGQEGSDRPDLRIEAEDEAALSMARAAAKAHGLPLIVLMNVSGPVEMSDWEADADAIACLYFPGMQGAKAAVDILLGDVNPSGKLPLTFPLRYLDCPTSLSFPGYNYRCCYGEGIYVGYRYYEKKQIPVRYPFGFGLSYTTFALDGLELPASVDVDAGPVTLRVRLRNTGEREGAEVVQVYVQDIASTLDKPVKELKAFRKVFLKPGEEQEITFTLSKEDFASYDEKLLSWVVEPGAMRILIGNASDHIELAGEISIRCADPYRLGLQTGIVRILSTPGAVQIFEEVTGLNLKAVAGSFAIFEPTATFGQVWDNGVVPVLNRSAKDAESLLRIICEKWQLL